MKRLLSMGLLLAVMMAAPIHAGRECAEAPAQASQALGADTLQICFFPHDDGPSIEISLLRRGELLGQFMMKAGSIRARFALPREAKALTDEALGQHLIEFIRAIVADTRAALSEGPDSESTVLITDPLLIEWFLHELEKSLILPFEPYFPPFQHYLPWSCAWDDYLGWICYYTG